MSKNGIAEQTRVLVYEPCPASLTRWLGVLEPCKCLPARTIEVTLQILRDSPTDIALVSFETAEQFRAVAGTISDAAPQPIIASVASTESPTAINVFLTKIPNAIGAVFSNSSLRDFSRLIAGLPQFPMYRASPGHRTAVVQGKHAYSKQTDWTRI